MTDEKELGRLLLNEETGLLTLKMNNLQDENEQRVYTLLTLKPRVNGSVLLTVVAYQAFSGVLEESNKHGIMVPIRM